jgi:hypothetical protein
MLRSKAVSACFISIELKISWLINLHSNHLSEDYRVPHVQNDFWVQFQQKLRDNLIQFVFAIGTDGCIIQL